MRDSGNTSRNQGAPLHDQVHHLPTYLQPSCHHIPWLVIDLLFLGHFLLTLHCGKFIIVRCFCRFQTAVHFLFFASL